MIFIQVINGEGINVAHLLIEKFFRCPDVADALNQLIKVVLTESTL